LPKIRLATALAVRSSIDGSTCWYRLAVIDVLAWPSRSETTLSGSPAASAAVA
jgi:hypothetical protein